MSQTHKDRREAYDKRTYKEYKLRVRRDSALFGEIEAFREYDFGSLNRLVTELLTQHFAERRAHPSR